MSASVSSARTTWRHHLKTDIADFPVTWMLSFIYVAIFAAMAVLQGDLAFGGGPLTFLSLSVDTLVDFGAIDGRRIFENHEWWRLLTATLLHASVIHLFLNVSALYQLGRIVEDWYGGWTLLVLHVVLGLAGSLASLWVHRMMPGRLIQVGGSGAIFGLAAFLLLATYFDDEHDSPQLFKSLAFTLMVGFGLGSLLGADDAAHVGGALAGAAFGTVDYAFKRGYWPKWFARTLGWASAGMIVAAFTGAGLSFGEASTRRHEEALVAQKRLAELEQSRLRDRAGQQVVAIYQYAASAIHDEKPANLERRPERAMLLDQLAQQIEDPALREYLVQIARRVGAGTDEAFLAKDNLREIVALILGHQQPTSAPAQEPAQPTVSPSSNSPTESSPNGS